MKTYTFIVKNKQDKILQKLSVLRSEIAGIVGHLNRNFPEWFIFEIINNNPKI